MESLNPEVEELSGLFFIFAARKEFEWVCKNK